MIKLPTADNLGFQRVNPQRSIVSSNSGQLVAQAAADAGRAMQNAGRDMLENQDRMEYAFAKSKILQDTISAKDELAQDQDYKTYGQRFQKRYNQSLGDASKMISNARIRTLFQAEAQDMFARAESDVKGLALRKEGDVGVASMLQVIQGNRNAALRAGDEETRTALLNATNDTISGAVERGYISAEAGMRQKMAFAEDYATGRLTMMSPDAQIQALQSDDAKSGWLSILPPNKQQQLVDSAYRAIDAAESSRDRQLSELAEQNNFELYNLITDPETRGQVSRDQIVSLVRQGRLKGSAGRTLINLLESDESREDDLLAYSEIVRSEADGTLTVEDIQRAHSNGRLKTATAKSLIDGITSNLSGNEVYQAGQTIIKAQFERGALGALSKPEDAKKEAQMLREYQRRASNPKEGETIDSIAEDIVGRMQRQEKANALQAQSLSRIKNKFGVDVNSVEQLELTSQRIVDANKRGGVTAEEMNSQLKVIKGQIEQLKSGM